MQNRLGDKQRLGHIIDAMTDIISFCKDLTYENYMDDYKLRLATVKLLEIIGEASAALSDDLKQEFSEIEWGTMKAARNVLVHEYFGIDYKIVWVTIQDILPELKDKISLIYLQAE